MSQCQCQVSPWSTSVEAHADLVHGLHDKSYSQVVSTLVRAKLPSQASTPSSALAGRLANGGVVGGINDGLGVTRRQWKKKKGR